MREHLDLASTEVELGIAEGSQDWAAEEQNRVADIGVRAYTVGVVETEVGGYTVEEAATGVGLNIVEAMSVLGMVAGVVENHTGVHFVGRGFDLHIVETVGTASGMTGNLNDHKT